MTNKEGIEPGRRSFLAALLSAGSVAVGALLSVPLLRFTLHPVLVRTTEKSWSDVGILDEFQKLDSPVKKLVTIEQRDGWRKTVIEKPVYVSKDSAGRLIVLSAVCTHPGCAIPWMEKGPEIRLPLPSGHVFAGWQAARGPSASRYGSPGNKIADPS